jgi:vitamin K-dependent gamma-carboxylase
MSRFPDRLKRALIAPVDSASLGVFRVGFGSLLAWEVWRAFDGNLIRADYDLPRYLFRWWLFEWVRPFPGPWLYVAFAVLGVAAAMLAAGLFTRVAAAVTCAGISYWFLLDKTNYLNHRYLAALAAFLLAIVPARAAFSLDARRAPTAGSPTVPAWSVWILRFQIAMPYFFGGVAKLNFDWLVRAEPLRSALAIQTDFPLLGRFFGDGTVAHVLAIGSAAFDLSVPFLLLHRRTRNLGFAMALAFHFINARLFEIGIFPWLMVVGSTLFFEPDWPRKLATSLRARNRAVTAAVLGGFAVGFVIGGALPLTFALFRALCGGFGVAVLAYHLLPVRMRMDHARQAPVRFIKRAKVRRRDVAARPVATYTMGTALALFLATWVVVQTLAPVAHFAFPGNVFWTEEGNRFSWHMLVRVKSADVVYRLRDPETGDRWTVDPADHLTTHQVDKLQVPDMILQFAHQLEDVYRGRGMDDIEVRADVTASLNGRRAQRMIDPRVDLTRISRPYLPRADWIVPLEPYR